jgi:hypothetical protein
MISNSSVSSERIIFLNSIKDLYIIHHIILNIIRSTFLFAHVSILESKKNSDLRAPRFDSEGPGPWVAKHGVSSV